jgi:hypothetical protein
VHLEDATSTTGFFVVAMDNGRLSQNIDHCPEARTNGRGLFRSLKPSAIDFPLQVQWIDRGHWDSPIFHKKPDFINAQTSATQLANPEPHVKFPNFIVPRHRTAFPTSSEHDIFVPGHASAPSDPRDCNMAPRGLAPVR